MSDRPIAPILAALAATMFVAAFAAAAVLRPDSAGTSPAARTAPATAQENANVATLVSPALSRVAALPALRLPKARKPAKKSKPAPTPTTSASAPAPAQPRVSTPQVTPPAPPVSRPVAPAPPRKRSNVGQTFDSEG
jgi:hypothetical protein